MRHFLSAIVSVLLFTCMLHAQSTFRGALAGTVTDSQGASIPGAQVEVTSDSTATVYKTVSTETGAFAVQDLPLGDYKVAVSFSGFATTKIDQIRVSAGVIFNLPVTLNVDTAMTTIEVNAAALTVDTNSQARTFTVPKEEVQDVPINGRSFTAMVNMLPGNLTGTSKYQIDGVDNNDMYGNTGAASNQGGVGGVPGTLLPIDSIEELSTQTQNGAEGGGNSGTTINAAIKSGTNTIHGTAYYFNRNEFFAAMGPFTKYNNQANFVAKGLPAPKKPPIHFQEMGGSIGGPLWKDKVFYFLNYERQQYVLGQGTSSQTEPSGAYLARAVALLQAGGVDTSANNQTLTMMKSLVTTLWQPGMITGPASPGNWTPPTSAAQNGYSNNVVVKFDQVLNQKNTLSERWYWGEGKQTAPLSTSQNPWYYQVAGERVDNVALTLNTSLNAKSSNQILMGVDYYNQPFGDANPNGGAAATGFIAGVGPGNTFGQPGIAISGFDGTGGTTVQIRNDFSGHLTETYSLTLGKHQIRAGGEYRRTQIFDVATGRGSSSIVTRGTFSFSGSRGFKAPSGGNGTSYPTTFQGTTLDSQTKALADYLQGEGSSANLYNGILDRNDSENNFNLFAQDNFEVTHNLTLSYGLRWEYLSPVGDDQRDLSIFRAGTAANPLAPTGGLAVIGQDLKEPYHAFAKQIEPRVGFNWQPTIFPSITKGMVIRGGIGLYFDQPGAGNWLNPTTAGSLAGNPAGTRPLYNETLSNLNIAPNVAIFPSDAAASLSDPKLCGPTITAATCPALAISAVDSNLSTGNTTNISFSVQKALGPKAVMEISYVGSRGRHLFNSIDLNQTTYGATTDTTNNTPCTGTCLPQLQGISSGFLYAQRQRPYFSQYPNFAKITEASSFGSSNANALQAYIRTRNWHGLISEVSYALSTSTGTGTIEDYNHPELDYGSNAVVTNQVKGYWTYIIPSLKTGPSWLVNRWITGGWQTTGTIVFKGATALTASSSGSCSSGVVKDSNGNVIGTNTYALTCSGLGLGEGAGRANLSGLPRFCPNGKCGGALASGVTGTSRNAITNGFIQWYNPLSVIAPSGCSVAQTSFGPDCSKPLSSYYGTTAPGQIHGAPGFGDIDLSIFKNFPITERIKGQFRGEMFNVLNRYNYKAPSLSAGNTATDLRYGGFNNSLTTGQINSTIGGTSAPGIAVGEPFNCQLAFKIIF